MRTPSPTPPARAPYGNLGTYDARARVSGGAGPFAACVTVGHFETDGYLRNAFVNRDALSTQLSLDLPADMTLSGFFRYTRVKSGMIVYNREDTPYYKPRKPRSEGSYLGGPGIAFRGGRFTYGDGSYWIDKRKSYGLSLERKTDEQLFDFHAQIYRFNETRDDYFYAIDDHHLILSRDAQPEDHNWGWRTDFKTVVDFLGEHAFEYGFEGKRLSMGEVSVSRVDMAYFWRRPMESEAFDNVLESEGVWLQDTWDVTKWLTLEPGVRFDHYEAHKSEPQAPEIDQERWSPRFAVTVRPWEGGHVTARYARAYRFPDIPEYYWWYAGYQPPNRRNLTSEKADQWELEVGHEITDKLTLTARGYYYDVQDYIRWIWGYRPSRVIYNINTVRFRGVELEASYQITPEWSVTANYTRQQADKHGDVLDSSNDLSSRLVELPRNKFNVSLAYHKKRGLDAELSVRFVDHRRYPVGDFTRVGGTRLERMNAFWDVGFHASYPVYQSKDGRFETRVAVAAENLVGQHYQEEWGYPMPGRTVIVGLRMSY